jgi:hypothetical protein
VVDDPSTTLGLIVRASWISLLRTLGHHVFLSPCRIFENSLPLSTKMAALVVIKAGLVNPPKMQEGS